MPSRPRFILLAAVVTAIGLLVAPVSAAERGRTHSFAGTESDPGGVHPDGVTCSMSGGGCRLVLVGNAAYAGGLTGTGAYVLRFDVVPKPDGQHYTGSLHFKRLVSPCGTGAIDVDLRGVYQTPRFDPASQTTTTVEHATFRSGSGTGGLAKMTGGWNAIVREHIGGTTDARYSGSMTCLTGH